ncbi:MAG: Hpt domain-containing protein [Candidatus Accumulibacter sp.]|jgi:chemosensory pili system protein ChpA (sensor histidine kinase/response regulator)|nr:Hpt domain-containing protein [Accumulibacter sp.]
MNEGVTEFDVGPLVWVKNEIDQALSHARQAFQHYVTGLSSGAGDPTQIRFCRTHLHQVKGALTIVGLDGVKQFTDALEALLETIEQQPLEKPPIPLLLSSIDSIGHYLDDLLAGQPDQPLRLFPIYEQIQQARGIEQISPTELFFPNLDVMLPKQASLQRHRLAPEIVQPALRQERTRFQRGFLSWLKNPGESGGVDEMLMAVQRIEVVQETHATRAFWWVAGALLSALAEGAPFENFDVKQLCSRIDLQIRRLSEGSKNVVERLMRDLLYFIATARNTSAALQQVREVYRLRELIPEERLVSTTPREIVRRKLREVITITGEEWNKYCAGAASSFPVFCQHAQLLASTVEQLGQADFCRLAECIVNAANWLSADVSRLSDSLAMETATAILLAQSAQKNFQALGNDFARQVDIAVSRVQGCLAGISPDENAECAALDEISSKAQEKLLIQQVAKEIKINLAQIEHVLDDFFRDASKRAELETLDVPVRQIAGALTMLRHDKAVAALDECRQEIQRFVRPDYISDGTDFERVASQLSIIGLFIDSIPYGPADFTSFTQKLRSELASPLSPDREADNKPRISFEQEIEQKKTEIHSLLGEFKEKQADLVLKAALRQHLEALQKDADLIDDAALGEQIGTLRNILSAETPDIRRLDAAMATLRSAPNDAPPEPSVETLELSQASEEKIDAELLEIFLQEARDVLGAVEAKLTTLKSRPGDNEVLMTIRRSFHTLKGSSRMVGLQDFGEAAWLVEQTLNLWLRKELDATPQILDLIGQAYAAFSRWIDYLNDPSAAVPRISEMTALARTLLDSRENDTATAREGAARQIGQSENQPEKAPANAPLQDRDPVFTQDAPDSALIDSSVSSATTPEISPDLREIFRQESASHLDALLDGLHELEQNEESRTPEAMYRAAHTLAGISVSVGLRALSGLAQSLQDALARRESSAQRGSLEAIGIVRQAVNEIDQILSFFGNGQEITLSADLIDALDALYPVQAALSPENAAKNDVSKISAARLETDFAQAGVQTLPARLSESASLADEIDEQLLPVFLDEVADLTLEISEQLRIWRENPDNTEAVRRLARLLHTLKGSARMAGAMNLGQMTHILESWVEKTLHTRKVSVEVIDEINEALDEVLKIIERLQKGETSETVCPPVFFKEKTLIPEETVSRPPVQRVDSSVLDGPQTDAHDARETDADTTQRHAMLRVRALLVDRLVNDACELSITRAQIESEMRGIKDSLIDLTENVTRLRRYLRDIHIQAESQMQSRTALDGATRRKFDPLEFDRFTRFQELTRMMAESVNDVGNVQQNLLKNLDSINSALLVQSRLNKEVQWDLMTIRMLPFGTIKERLYRIVRQTSKELGKRVNLEITGEQVELDRSVLDKMIPALEHLLRNAIAHGIEDHTTRMALGKPEIGEISLSLRQEGNEIILRLSDDGAGLDFECIRWRALETGLLKPDEDVDKKRLVTLIFMPGFSTAAEVSQIAGRGVGMDVVKTEVSSLGGRIETSSEPGKGTEFRIYLPLTMAVSQILLLRAGRKNHAIPSPMVEQVLEIKEGDLERIRKEGYVEWMNGRYPCHYLPRLLGDTRIQPEQRPPYRILLLRNGMRRISLEVDEVVGSREIIVKNIGPQLTRVAGLDGATVLANGQIVLILNPIALSLREPPPDSALSEEALRVAEMKRSGPPTIMIVDDSLTIRKITNRLLSRNGYQTLLARDGVEAMELLNDTIPDIMLVDIEMPRMDGFELTRNIRSSERLKDIPIIMITSRTADKHRNYAFEIGVNHFLGKPFQEEEVLKLVAHHVEHRTDAINI